MPEKIKGLLESGNVGDLPNRPRVKNADGSVSTIRSMSFNDGKHEVLIPTANDGVVQSDEDAISRYEATGEHLGKFSSPEAATAYAEKLHRDQAAQTEPRGRKAGDVAAEEAERYLNNQPRLRRGKVAEALESGKQTGLAAQREAVSDSHEKDMDASEAEWRSKNQAGQVDGEWVGGDPWHHEVDHSTPPTKYDPASYVPSNEDPFGNRMDKTVAVKQLAKKYVEWVTKQRETTLPHQAADAQRWIMDKLHPHARQDAELQVLREQQEAARQQLAPRDEGEIDEPGARRPIQMQREFSNDQEKDAYLERIRQAQKNAGAK